MMDPLGINNVLQEDDGGFPETSKVDFDGSDFDNIIMDSAEFDKILSEGAAAGTGNGFELDDADIDKMMNPDDLTLDRFDGSDGFIDQLASMPIVEVQDERVDKLLGNTAREENIQLPVQKYQTTACEELMAANVQPHPLLGTLSNNIGRMSIKNTHNCSSTMVMDEVEQRQQVLQQIPFQHASCDTEAEVDALQRMVDEAVMEEVPNNNSRGGGMGDVGVLDLEQEKMKLLSRLHEINQRKNLGGGGGMGMQATANPRPNPFLHSSGMSQMQSMLQQQQRPDGVASVGTSREYAETPLTSFLRKSQKSQSTSMNAVSDGRSMLGGSIPVGHKAASVLSESPIEFNNPLLSGSRNQYNPFGAMDRRTATQDIVQKLSARSYLARTDSGARMRGGMAAQKSNNGNATWGKDHSSLSFETSGILPRHVSESNLGRASKSSMTRSRSKNGCLSRENLMYMKRTSRNSSEDSLGSMLPVKRSGGIAKHKRGLARSVPHLMAPNVGGRSGAMQHGGSQMNAMW